MRDLHIIIIFMAITSSINIPQLSRNAWALNEMALCARPMTSFCKNGGRKRSGYARLAFLWVLSGWRWSHQTREGCSGLERPLALFELERTREQKKPYLAKRTSWRRHSQSLSERLTPLGSTRDTGFIFQRSQLRSCDKCFSHYRQPSNLDQSVLVFERCEAANAKALIFLDLVHPTYGPPQLCWSSVAIDALQYSCVVGSDIINMHEM